MVTGDDEMTVNDGAYINNIMPMNNYSYKRCKGWNMNTSTKQEEVNNLDKQGCSNNVSKGHQSKTAMYTSAW